MSELLESSLDYLLNIDYLEASGMIFGLLAVYFLIKENVWTWPFGIAYVLVSFVIFYREELYGDFGLHIVFLILNIYGWWWWTKKPDHNSEELVITTTPLSRQLFIWVLSIPCIYLMGFVLEDFMGSSLPYWDSATTTLSLFGMWLTAKKKIENWHFWLVVDILATGIYFYKGIYFYAFLYMVYIGMAVAGFLAWRNSLNNQLSPSLEKQKA